MKLLNTITTLKSTFILLLLLSGTVYSQDKTDSIAENMLIYQRSYGGWPKAINEKKIVYEQTLSESEKQAIKLGFNAEDATIDNKATSREIRYLVGAYKQTGNPAYLQAAKKGLDYLLEAQYDNGGWPQYYPAKNLYRGQITYNDNAMVNVLNILQDVIERSNDFDVLDASYANKCKQAVNLGVDCILKTQLTINGEKTAWAAQYDEKTLLPAKARVFEPASLSSSESVGVVSFLMRLPNPSPEIKTAVTSAMDWFDQVKIVGYTSKIITDAGQPTGKDRIVEPDTNSVIWSRFYDMETFEPIFIGRDTIIKKNLAEIDNERRVGYAWYGIWPLKLQNKEFPKWSKKYL